MAIDTQQPYRKRFVIKRSDLTTLKLFVEFYLPEYQDMLNTLRQGPYPLKSLGKLSTRMFDGPFGSNRKVDMYQESGIPYVRVKDVLPDGIDLSGLTYISQEKHQTIYRSRVVPGNVLVTIAGRLGTAAVFPERLGEGNITGHIAGIEIPEDVSPHYLAAVINSRFGEFQVKRWGHRTTRPELNLREVRQILIPLPPRPIQDRIAQVMQDAYTTRREKLADAETLLAGIENYILEMLSINGDLPKEKKRFTAKRSQLHRVDVRYFSPFYDTLEQCISEGAYPAKPLSTICEKLINGLTPARSAYTEDGHVVIKVASLTKDWQIDWAKVAFTSEALFNRARKAHVSSGDLLILSASHQLDYIGRNFALVRDVPDEFVDRCMAVGELIIARPRPQFILPEFLLACFTIKPTQELVNRMTRGQSAHLYARDLKSLEVPVPPLEVQREIVDTLNQRRTVAERLRSEAETVVAEAKACVERMILSQEEIQ